MTIYRAPDARQNDLVVNIAIYSLSLHLSQFVCDLRGVENTPNIEQGCEIGYRNMETEMVTAVGSYILHIHISSVVHPVKYMVHNNKVEMVSIQ